MLDRGDRRPLPRRDGQEGRRRRAAASDCGWERTSPARAGRDARAAFDRRARADAFFLNAILAASSYERFLDTMLFVPEDEAKDAKGESKDDYADAKDVQVADAKDAK